DLRGRLQGKRPGDTVNLTVSRGGSTTNVTVTLAAPSFGPGGALTPGMHRPFHGGEGFGGPFPVPGLAPLRGAPADQRFAHMLGSQLSFLDAPGRKVTYQTIPGKLTAVSATSVTIQPNDSSLSGGPYTVNADTVVGGPRFHKGLDQLKVGDR